jgi:uncharacterized protein DUF4333
MTKDGARRRTPALVLCAVALAIVTGGCAEKQVDTSRAESEIRRDLADQTGATVKSVRCPDEVTAKKGDRFTCRAVADDDSKIPIRVTQVDGDGGLRWRIGR